MRESRLAQPRFRASVSSLRAMSATRMGTCSSRASSVARVTSLWARRRAKFGGSYGAGQEIVDQAVEGARAADRALAHGLQQRERIDAGFDAQREDLGQRGLDGVAGAIVDQLGDAPGADRADVDHLVADGVEHRAVLVEDGFVAADPDRQLARLRTGRSAAHGRVEQVHAARGERRVEPSGERGRAGAQSQSRSCRPTAHRAARWRPSRPRAGLAAT